jgi:hypothetical protein
MIKKQNERGYGLLLILADMTSSVFSPTLVVSWDYINNKNKK